MTVIDVQVFSSSHTETLEQHTHGYRTYAEAHYTCMHSIVVSMHTKNTCKQSCTYTIMHICLSHC